MDWTAKTATSDSEIINENAHTGDAWIRQYNQPLGGQKSQRNCFRGSHMDSTTQTGPRASEITNETPSTCDAWIGQRKQPLVTSKSLTKLLRWVTHGFDSANSPYGHRNHQRKCSHGWCMDSTARTAPKDSEIIKETALTGDAWIR